MSTRPALISDIAGGWFAALFFSFIAAIPLGLLGVVSLFQRLTGHTPEVTFALWLALVAVIALSYFVAGTLAGIAYWLTRPLRPGLIGNALSGALIAPCIYGSVAATGYVFWNPVGAFVFGRSGDTREEFGTFVPIMALIAVGIGLVVGPFLLKEDR